MNYLSFFSILDIKSIKRVGIGFTGLFNNDIMTTSYEGENYITGNESTASFYSLIAGYGLNITKEIDAGANLKIPIEKLGENSTFGMGIDIGGIYKKEKWNASLVIQNIGIDLKRIDQTHYLPLTVKIGGAYHFNLFKKNPKIHIFDIMADIEIEVEKNFTGGVGIQYSYNNMIFLRNGYNISKDNLNIKLGGGILYKNYQLDYGYNWKGPGHIHQIGFRMTFDFDRKIEEKIITKETEEGFLIRISEKNIIIFEPDQIKFKKDAFKILNKITSILKAQKNKDILISGHTDNIGDVNFNLQLSQQRAKSVYDYFVKKGININRMMIKGYGNEKPIASNNTEMGREINRRIDIILLKLSKEEKEKFNEHYNNGMDYYMMEEYKSSITEWEKALEIDTGNKKLKEWIQKAKVKKEEKKIK